MRRPQKTEQVADKCLLAGGRIDAGVGPGPSVDDGVSAVDHAALVRDAEGPQSIEVVTEPGIVGFFRQRAHSWPDVVRYWKKIQNRQIRCWPGKNRGQK